MLLLFFLKNDDRWWIDVETELFHLKSTLLQITNEIIQSNSVVV